MWWRTRLEDQKAGRPVPTVNNWEDLCALLKQQFKPESADLELRYKFRYMRQTGSLRDYIQTYRTYMLQMPNWVEEEKVHFFITGLKPGPMAEVRKARPQTAEEAIAIAAVLEDHQFGKDANNSGPFQKSEKKLFQKKNDEKSSGTTKSAGPSSSTKTTGSSKPKDKKETGKKGGDEAKTKPKNPKNKGCFVCGNKGHWAKEFPER